MSILIFALLVIVVLCLVCWVISLLPFPASPPHIKEILMAICLLIGIVVIINRAGLL